MDAEEREEQMLRLGTSLGPGEPRGTAPRQGEEVGESVKGAPVKKEDCDGSGVVKERSAARAMSALDMVPAPGGMDMGASLVVVVCCAIAGARGGVFLARQARGVLAESAD